MAPVKRTVSNSPSSSTGYRKEQEYGATSGEFESRDSEAIPRAASPVTASPGTASNFEEGKIYSSTLGGSVGQSRRKLKISWMENFLPSLLMFKFMQRHFQAHRQAQYSRTIIQNLDQS